MSLETKLFIVLLILVVILCLMYIVFKNESKQPKGKSRPSAQTKPKSPSGGTQPGSGPSNNQESQRTNPPTIQGDRS